MKTNQTYYWPTWFRQTLTLPEKKQINPKLIKQLSNANLYLWHAYNIYDDIIDTKTAYNRLPEANKYYRKFLEIYYRLNLDVDFYNLFNAVIADLETANREEILQNKININEGKVIYPPYWPNFSDLTRLSRKSLALGLGPIAILTILNNKNKYFRIKHLLNFFRSALAAKQLADDIYDWFEDLKNGLITAANIPILIKAKKKKIILNINNHPEIAYSLFITEASEKINSNLQLLCRQSRIAANQAFIPQNCRLVESILAPLEKNLIRTSQNRSSYLKKYAKILK